MADGALFRGVRRSQCLPLVGALIATVPSLLGRVGLAFLLIAAIGLAIAARFPMDPVSTPPGQRSFSGKMHGASFLMGVPCQLLAVLLVSLALGSHTSYGHCRCSR